LNKLFLLILPFLVSFGPPEIEITPDDIPSNENWAFVGEEEGIKTYRAKIENSNLYAFQGMGIVNASAPSIMTVLRNVEQSSKWSPMLDEKITLEEESDLLAYTYQHHNLPWPVNNRYLILKNKLWLSKKNKALIVIMHSANHDYKKAEGIRMHMGFGLVLLRPVDSNRSYMEVKIHLDPKGYIPDWLVNIIQKQWPRDFLKAVEKEAQKTRPNVRKEILTLYTKLQKLLVQPKKQ